MVDQLRTHDAVSNPQSGQSSPLAHCSQDDKVVVLGNQIGDGLIAKFVICFVDYNHEACVQQFFDFLFVHQVSGRIVR